MQPLKSNDFAKRALADLNGRLAQLLSAEVIVLRAPMKRGVDTIIRREIEALCGAKDLPQPRLIVILETNGGFIEVVERIYAVFRNHYDVVDFIIPNYAYSAGTVLALSGDDIYMDYYSVLGPIDPQLENEDGQFVPGMGYLHEYEELVTKINTATTPMKAELAYLLKRFDPARLFNIKQARDHSKSLLRTWLPKHKFKNWVTTETAGTVVDDDLRRRRAEEIAEVLGDPKRWHSHGRGIGIHELSSEEIRLVVRNFGDDPELKRAIRDYYDLFIDFTAQIKVQHALHTRRGHRKVP